MKHALRFTFVASLAVSLSACGATSHATPVSQTHADEARVEQSGALSLLTLERPMGETIALSLWVDAGTLDGPNASHALIAASIVTARTGLQMRVTPDATSFRQLCTRNELTACVDRFGDALATREVAEEEFAAARAEIRERRERSFAEPARASLGLAVESLLGYAMHPLGDAEDEITRETLSTFLRMHYGPNRALVIAVGAHEHDALREATSRIDGPHAETSRAEREEHAGVLHALEESHLEPSWTFAARGASESDAQAMANAWRGRAGDRAQVSLFPTRLGWVATLTLQGNDPALLSHAATWMRARAGTTRAPQDDDAWSLSHRHGEAWAARPDATTGRVAFAGVGAVDVSLSATLDALLAPHAPTLARTDHGVRVELDGGVLHIVDALGGERGAVEVRMEGAATDGPNVGASAIAMEALRSRCFAGAETSLDGAAIRVTVRDDAPALAERAAWIIDCVALARPAMEALDHAQRTRIAHAADDAERRAIVARMLSPQAPGWILPEGSHASLGDTTLEDVNERIQAWSGAFEVRLGWPTQLSDEDALTLAQRILPPRTARADALRAPPTSRPIEANEVRVHADLPAPEVILAVRVDGVDLRGSGAGACVPIQAWTRQHAISPTWQASGEARGWSWCAVALPTWPEGDAPSLDTESLREQMQEASAQTARTHDLMRADVAGAARALWEDGNGALAGPLEVSLRRAFVEPSPPPLRRRASHP